MFNHQMEFYIRLKMDQLKLIVHNPIWLGPIYADTSLCAKTWFDNIFPSGGLIGACALSF